MSGTNADSSAPREHLGGVLGGFLCLLAIPAIALMIFGSQGGALDGATLWGEVFAEAPAEFGFEAVQAARLPGGNRVTVLRRSAPEPRGPEQLALVLYASPQQVSQVMEASSPGGFSGRRGRRGGGGGEEMKFDSDGPLTLQHGLAEWGDLRARFVHTREWEKQERDEDEEEGEGEDGDEGPDQAAESGQPSEGEKSWKPSGPATDTIRLNLSVGGRYCVLFATWAEGEPADVVALEDLLPQLGFLEPVEGLGSVE